MATTAGARRFATLARLGQAVTASLDLGDVLDTVARAATDLLRGSHTAIWVAEDERLVRRASAGGRESCGESCLREIAVGEGLIGGVAATRMPMAVADVSGENDSTGWVQQHQYVSFLAIPLLVRDRLVGVLSLGAWHRHVFSLHEMEVLGAFGDQAAIAVGNAGLYATLIARVRRLHALTRMTRLISSSLDPDAVLQEIADAAASFGEARVASIWSADDVARALTLVASSREAMRDFPTPTMDYDAGILGWVATRREAAQVSDVFADTRFVVLDWWRARGLSSFLGIPVVLDDELVAVLALHGDRPLAPTASEERDLLESFAAQAAVAIRNARLFTDSERRRRAAEALQRIGRDLAHSLDPEEVGARVVASVLGLIGAKRASLYRLEDDSGDLILLATAGEVKPANDVLPHGVGTAGLAAVSRRPVACSDVLADDRLTWTAAVRAAIEPTRYRAVLSVPLLVRSRLFGVLAIADEAGRAFTIDEVSLAQAFADQAALALDNARLLHESRTRQARLETLLEVSRELSGIQLLDRVLNRIAEACGRVLDSGSVGFRIVEDDELVVRGVWGDAGAVMAKPRLKIGESLSGRVVATGQPLIVQQLADAPDLIPEHREQARLHGLRAFLGVPVNVGERVAGVLTIRSLDDRAFGDAELATATAFAAQAAVALQNASLYGELQAQLRRTEALLNVTRAVSTTLDLDEAMRRVARETARLLGADMVGAYLADADGKSLWPAAGYRVPAELRDAFRRHPIPLAGHAFVEDAWHRRTTVWSSDVEREPGIDRETIARFPHRALLFSPMVAQGRSIGGLFVLWWKDHRTPSAEEIRLLEGLADQAALSFETTRLYEQSERGRRAAEALLEVGQALASTLEPAEIFTLVTRRTAQALGAERCSLYELRHGRLVPLMSQYADGRTDKTLWALFKTLPRHRPDDVPVYAEAVRTRRPVVVADATAPGAPVPPEWVDTFAIRSLLVVPLFHQDKLLGMLNFDTTMPAPWRREQIDLAMTIANQTALAIENARLFAAQREEAQVSSALLRLARSLEPLQDLNAVLEVAVARAPELLGLTRCSVLVVDPSTGELVPTVASGLAEEHRPAFQALRGVGAVPAFAEAIRSHEVVAVPDATEDTWIPRAVARELDVQAMLIIPLVSGGRLMGALIVDTPGRAAAFDDKQLAVARGIASHLAGAIDRAQLHAESERRRREAEIFAELARTINASLDLPTVMQHVAEWARELCRSDGAAAALREGDVMTLRYWVGRDNVGPLTVEPGKGAGGLVMTTGRPFRTADYASDPRITKDYADIARGLGAAAQLVVPIHIADQVEGLLYAGNRAPRPFTERDEAILVRLAEHAAIALKNSRLFAREQESQRFLQSTLDALSAHVAVLDETGTIIAVNGAWRRFADAHRLGDRPYGLGDNYLAVCEAARGEGAAEAAAVAAAIRTVLRGERAEFHLEYDCHGPTDRRWFVVRITRFTGPGLVRVVVAHENISERRLAEEALQRNEEHVRQVQKMEAVGRLAGGIAHDFNNLLTVITGRTQLALRRLREDDPMRHDLGLIRTTAERAATLTRQLLAFSRKQLLQPRVVEVEAVVRGLVPMLQRLLGEDVELIIPPVAGPARVKADPGQLEQVIVNLAVNARDAMPQGGRLTVRIGLAELDDSAARAGGAAQPGSYVVLSVIDSGIGMDEATKARIFEPFFTTKELGHGTGLGLATVYGIVQQHQGRLTVESEPGRGTTFHVYLPATTETPEPAASERPTGLPGGAETVLLVEDETEVRELVRDMLRQLGYTVLEAGNGPEAMEIGRRYRQPIHLLLSDVIMPHMSGRELAERMTHERPGL
ncbi:MAG TPA: GAF domain-containing protein, partial [Methylomirabilota bacterium]|nr:GAF domain-containing protein [Methylomirabilota bacterium]